MKKLSEFANQQHITSVLRAMVIRESVNTKISIVGDDAIASEIMLAFEQSLNCDNPQRGDACGICSSCVYMDCNATWGNFLLTWQVQHVTEAPTTIPPQTVVFSKVDLEGFLHFQIKIAAGKPVNADVLALLIYAYQGTKEDTFVAAKKIARDLLFIEYQQYFLDILTNILYLKNNLEIKEVEKLDVLRALSVRISIFDVTACIRILWESENTSALNDALRIEVVSLLISEALQPTPAPSLQDFSSDKPIKVIEDDNLEQPLDLSEMLALAHE